MNHATPQADRRARETLAAIIERRRDEIERRWLHQIVGDIAGRPIDPTRLRNALPDYLKRLAQSLRADPSLDVSGSAAWVDVAREHAVTRVHLGFDVKQLVHEFAVLRRVIVAILRETGELHVEPLESISELIESAVAEAVDSYVRARDYESRRVEAEHIGFIAHELRSPLTTAQLVVGQLRSDAKLCGDSRVDLLDRTIRRTADLIESVLHAERLEAQAIEAHCETVSLREILEGPLDGAAVRAQAKGIELRVAHDPETAVVADRELTTSAVENLIDNAIKFTNRGRVSVQVEDRSDIVVLHVRDTGPGISREELDIIFEPFRRGSNHRAAPGTGLGLAIAKRALEAQGGSIHCESQPDEGTHFWFTLPKPAH
jgi:signal transduction histidine kinase